MAYPNEPKKGDFSNRSYEFWLEDRRWMEFLYPEFLHRWKHINQQINYTRKQMRTMVAPWIDVGAEAVSVITDSQLPTGIDDVFATGRGVHGTIVVPHTTARRQFLIRHKRASCPNFLFSLGPRLDA